MNDTFVVMAVGTVCEMFALKYLNEGSIGAHASSVERVRHDV